MGEATREKHGGGLRVTPRFTSVALAATLLGAGSEERVHALPCSHCHDAPTGSELRYHEERREGLVRTRTPRWCLDCHAAAGSDVLPPSSGDRALFTASYQPCARCHHGDDRDGGSASTASGSAGEPARSAPSSSAETATISARPRSAPRPIAGRLGPEALP